MATLTASAPASLPSVSAPRLLRAALPLLIAAPVVLGVQAGGVWVLAQLAKPAPAASTPAATPAPARTAPPLFASTHSSAPVVAKAPLAAAAPVAEAAAPPAPAARTTAAEVPAGEHPAVTAKAEAAADKPMTATPVPAPVPGARADTKPDTKPQASPVQATTAPEAPPAPVARVEAVAPTPTPAPAPAGSTDAAPAAVSPVSPTAPAVSPVTRPTASVLVVPPPYVPVAPYAVAVPPAPARAAVAPAGSVQPVARPLENPAPAPQAGAHETTQLLGPDWVRAQPLNNRTLQLMAGDSLEALREYVRSHDFADVPVAYVPSVRDGQPWYYLIAGSFASVQESSAAERVLKSVQSGLKPWTRRFGGMQALIKP